MYRFALILLAMALVLIGTPDSNAASKDTLTIALTGEPPTMDPHRTSNFIGSMVWQWSYDNLIHTEAGTGKLIPWLAEKWEKIEGSKRVKFWLRKDAKFTDGSPVTSEAVKFTMSRVMKAKRQASFFKTFDRIEIIDDKTFIWHNKKHDNGMFNRIARWAGPISLIVKKKDKATISRNTYGSGPYILKSWTKGQKMVFVANPNWWGNKTYPKRPKTVVLRRIREGATRVKALLAGEVDIITGVMPHLIAPLKKNPNVKIAVVPGVRIMYMGLFTRHGGPLANLKVRKAINYALDVEQVKNTILGGRADIYGQIFHPWNFAGHNPNKKWYGYDLAKAKALMKEAGYAQGFKMELFTPNGRYPGDKATCEASAGMLKKIGIDTTCNSVTFPLFRKLFTAYRTGKKKGAAAYYQGIGNGTGDPGLALRIITSCKGPWSGHCFKDLDAASDKAAATADPQKQQIAFEAVTDLMKKKATHKIFFKTHDVFGYNSRLKFNPRHDEVLQPWDIGF